MGNVVLGLGISVDGCIARPNGTVDFLFMPKDYSIASFFATIDTALMGRKTFDADLQMGGGFFGSSSMATFVFSNSKPPGARDSAVFTNSSSSSASKNIWLMGGASSPASFSKRTWSMNSTSALFRSYWGKAFRSSPTASRSATSP